MYKCKKWNSVIAQINKIGQWEPRVEHEITTIKGVHRHPRIPGESKIETSSKQIENGCEIPTWLIEGKWLRYTM